jgi:hypothetical protein
MAATAMGAFLGEQVLQVIWQEPSTEVLPHFTLEDSRTMECQAVRVCPQLGFAIQLDGRTSVLAFYNVSKVGEDDSQQGVPLCFSISPQRSSPDLPTLGKVCRAGFLTQRALCTMLPRRPARNDRDMSRDARGRPS